MNQDEPQDKIVQDAITNAISQVKEPIKPNKLRKIICKNVKGTNWTQYQRVLDLMLKEKSFRSSVVNKELFISPMNANKVSSNPEASNKNSTVEKDNSIDTKNDVNNTDTTTTTTTTTMKVPLAIVYHLRRKGQKKQKNMEQNTKTSFIFDKQSLTTVKKKTFDPNEIVTFTIQSLLENHDEITAKKHIKTVQTLISKMIQSFKDNPDHYRPKEAGGTFKEQEDAKKRKMELRQKWKGGKHSHSHSHSHAGNEVDNDNGESQSEVKKRRRKYY